MKASIPVADSVLDKNMEFRPVVLIPVYNHEAAIGTTLSKVLQYDCPGLLVDDGSKPVCHDVLMAFAAFFRCVACAFMAEAEWSEQLI